MRAASCSSEQREASAEGLTERAGSRSPVVAAVALDETFDEVVRASADFARRLGAPLLPVHAVTPALDDAERMESAVSALLDAYAPELALGLDLEGLVVAPFPDAAWLVATIARKHGARLVVVSGGQRSGLRRWLHHGTAERLAQLCGAPLLVARGPAPAEISRVRCVLDLGRRTGPVVDAALSFARAFETGLDLSTIIAGEHAWVGRRALARFEGRSDEAARAELASVLDGHDLRGLELSIDVRAGDPADSLVRCAETADLVVLPNTAGAGRGLDGATRTLLRTCFCSVVLVPDPQARSRSQSRDDARTAPEARS